MAASAGTLVAIGKSGKQYIVDLYIPDAAAGLVTFNPSGLAVVGSPTYWRAPEDVVVRDVSVITGMAAVGAFFTSSGAIVNGAAIRYPVQLNTLATRPTLAIQIRGGELLGMTNF